MNPLPLGRVLIAGLLCALCVSSAFAKDPKPPVKNPDAPANGESKEDAAAREAREKAFVLKVNKAIDRGVAYLKKTQGKDGLWSGEDFGMSTTWTKGEQALCLLTLIKCGVKKSDPVVRSGLRALNRPKDTSLTYQRACLVMLDDAIKSKSANSAHLAWFKGTQRERIWRYGRATPATMPEDLSCAQYALLAIWTLAKNGRKIDAERLRRALGYLITHQEKDGPAVPTFVENPTWEPGARYARYIKAGSAKARGWGYGPTSTRATGAMTAAGIASLAIIKDLLASERGKDALKPKERKQIDAALIGGLAWLDHNFSVQANPGGKGRWLYYYLYGLERVGALLGVKRIGKRDWYRHGAEYLIEHQEQNGAWPPRSDKRSHETRHVNTCFALLFLKRATIPPKNPLAPPATTGG